MLPMLGRKAFAQEPKRGGRFRLGLAGSVEQTLDPAIVQDAVNQNINYQTHNTLVEVLPDLTAGPELAESWEASPDAKVWTFKLRKGVQFHDGKPFEAEDVIYSLEHHRKPDSKSSVAILARQIADIKAEDKHTLVMTLTSANADFPITLSDYHFIIFPKDTTDFDKAIGTGAYVLESFEAGVRTVTKRNSNYWRTDRGFFDEVETLTINDASARTSALISGQVDHINRLDLQTAKLLEQNPQVHLLRVDGMKFLVVNMMVNGKPFDNVDARLAMKYGIDREAFVEKILSGYGKVGNDHPISTLNRFYNGDLPQRTYDPDKALFHLKKAGYQDYTFALHAGNTGIDGMVDAMVLFQQDLQKAGIKMDITREPIDGYWSRVQKKVPFYTSYWAGRPAEDMILSVAYAGGSNFNETDWKNDRFDSLLVAARGELNNDKRREMYYECQKLINEDAGTIVPVWVDHLMATGLNVAHPAKVGSNAENDGHRCAERWWFT